MLKKRRATTKKVSRKAPSTGVVLGVRDSSKISSPPPMIQLRHVSKTIRDKAAGLTPLKKESWYATCAAYGLFLSLLLQPVAPVFAQTVDVDASASAFSVPMVEVQSTSDDEADTTLYDSDSDSTETEMPDATESTSELQGTEDESSLDIPSAIEATTTTQTSSEPLSEDTSMDSGEGEADPEQMDSVSEEVDGSDVLDDTSDETQNEDGHIDDDIQEVDIATGDDSVDSLSTSTDSIATTTDVVATSTEFAINPSNRYQFAERECRAIGGGAFYCQEAEQNNSVLEDGVFAAPDVDGDLEIYVRIDGTETQLTSNTYEDGAPYYDPVSERVVWHALVNDRYQIFVYELNDDRLTQLTKGSENNMQPALYGDDIFWQSWINNNWEIMQYDGNQIKRLTNNTEPDIAPYAQDTYLMWQAERSGMWQTALYDLSHGTLEYLDGVSEGVAKNPRLVVMYESYDAYGDVHMFGYDLRTKENIALTHTSIPVPTKLPEPDGEQEKRALVNAKPVLKEDGDEDEGDPLPGSTPTTTPAIVPPETPMTLVIPPLASSTEQTFDEIVAPTTTPAHIEDLIIQPLP